MRSPEARAARSVSTAARKGTGNSTAGAGGDFPYSSGPLSSTSLSFDPTTIKHQLLSHRQRIAGYRIEHLSAWSSSQGTGRKKENSRGHSQTDNRTVTRPPDQVIHPTRGTGHTEGQNQGSSEGSSESRTESTSTHEINVPIHEEVEELSGVTFKSFDEEATEWGKVLRFIW